MGVVGCIILYIRVLVSEGGMVLYIRVLVSEGVWFFILVYLLARVYGSLYPCIG